MRQELKALYRKLIRSGKFRTAHLILKLMRTGMVYIGDGNDEAYESGVVEYLQKNLFFLNSKYGFFVYDKS